MRLAASFILALGLTTSAQIRATPCFCLEEPDRTTHVDCVEGFRGTRPATWNAASRPERPVNQLEAGRKWDRSRLVSHRATLARPKPVHGAPTYAPARTN